MDERPVILIVDDEATQRAILFDQLDNRGYRILLAEDGETAVEITKLIRPNIILLDVMLPGINGYEACRQIKVHGQNTDIPVLFMTGLDDGPTRSAIYKAGGNAHLLKPPVPIEVITLIEQYLELEKYRKQERDRRQAGSAQSEELERYIDYIAHDMKSPLLSILGFSEELSEEFKEQETPEEWKDYANLIRQSSASANGMLDALVLLKNLPNLSQPQKTSIALSKLIENTLKRYREMPEATEIEEQLHFYRDNVETDPILFEELLLVILRIIAQLNPDVETIPIAFTFETSNNDLIQGTIDATTRPLDEQEGTQILEPLTAQKRNKVIGTDAFTICAQKIIEILRINIWTQATETGLRIQFTIKAG